MQAPSEGLGDALGSTTRGLVDTLTAWDLVSHVG